MNIPFHIKGAKEPQTGPAALSLSLCLCMFSLFQELILAFLWCGFVGHFGLMFLFSVSGLLCHLFMSCRSQCKLLPIPLFLVLSANRSCLYWPILYKYVILLVLAQWRLVPLRILCPKCSQIVTNVCQLIELCLSQNKGCVNRESWLLWLFIWQLIVWNNSGPHAACDTMPLDLQYHRRKFIQNRFH